MFKHKDCICMFQAGWVLNPKYSVLDCADVFVFKQAMQFRKETVWGLGGEKGGKKMSGL